MFTTGTFTGASALAWALALPSDGQVISMDVSHEELNRIGRSIIDSAPEIRNKIDFRLGSAVDTLGMFEQCTRKLIIFKNVLVDL
jgi:predicted O-methyltransferase YrrM